MKQSYSHLKGLDASWNMSVRHVLLMYLAIGPTRVGSPKQECLITSEYEEDLLKRDIHRQFTASYLN